MTFFTAFTTANLKNGTGRKFYILYAKFAMSITHLLLKLPDKQNLCNAKRRKLHGFASFCAIRYKKIPHPIKLAILQAIFLIYCVCMQCVKCCDSYALMTVRPANFTSAKKTPARLAKHLQTFFLLTFQKQKPRKTRGCFVEIYSASSSLLRSKADCRS